MSINDLPIELLTKILDYVFLCDHGLADLCEQTCTISYVGSITPCMYFCRQKRNNKCVHISSVEIRSLKKLTLVCKLWYIIIQDHKYTIYEDEYYYKKPLVHTLNF